MRNLSSSHASLGRRVYPPAMRYLSCSHALLRRHRNTWGNALLRPGFPQEAPGRPQGGPREAYWNSVRVDPEDRRGRFGEGCLLENSVREDPEDRRGRFGEGCLLEHAVREDPEDRQGRFGEGCLLENSVRRAPEDRQGRFDEGCLL